MSSGTAIRTAWRRHRLIAVCRTAASRRLRNGRSFGAVASASQTLHEQRADVFGMTEMALAGGLLAAYAAMTLSDGGNNETACEAVQSDSFEPMIPLNKQQPRNVMIHRMRSLKGRNLNDKYKVDWKTVLGEGAYGSVHPSRVAVTGEKVSVLTQCRCFPVCT
jgi:hypothetical protein